MQQTYTHPFNISPENPSKTDNFSKLSKSQIVLIITGRGHAVKQRKVKREKRHNIWPHMLTTQTGKYFIFKQRVVIFTFKISIPFY